MLSVKSEGQKTIMKEKTEKKEPVGLDMVVYNQEGKETGKISLPAKIFGLKVKEAVISQAVQAQLSVSRVNRAHTKTRGEVRGGGKKPWRQKGTGRARHGSTRSPIWIGGGVTFGPRNDKNFAKKINKKMKRQAILMALSGKFKDNEILLMDDLKLENIKTKELARIISNFKKEFKKDFDRSILFILPRADEKVILSARNLKNVGTIGAGSLNIIDLLSKKYLVMTRETVSAIEKVYSK